MGRGRRERERGGRRNAEEGKIGARERDCDGGRTMSQLLPYLHATSALTAVNKTADLTIIVDHDDSFTTAYNRSVNHART